MANLNDESFILDAINMRVKARTAEIALEEGKKAAAEVVRRVEAEADKLALDLLAMYDVQRHGTNIVITVRKSGEKP